MAELKFLRGLLANLPEESGRTTDNFYVTTGAEDGEYRLYLGGILLAQGDVVKRLEDLESLMGGEDTGSVADQIQAAIALLDKEVSGTSTDGFVTVKVTEVDGKLDAVVVTTNDIAKASELDALEAAVGEGFSAEATVAAAIAANNKAIEDEAARADAAEKVNAQAIADEATARTAAIDAIKGELAETDAKTLATLNDRIDGVVADTKTYSVQALTEDEIAALSDAANVKEAYKLVETVGESSTDNGDVIKIYKDSSLISVSLESENAEGVKGQFLKYTYVMANGENEDVYVNVSEFLVQAEFKDGLVVSAAGEVSVNVDADSEGFLTVGEAGVKLSGVQAAIDAERDRALSAETANANAITAEKTAREEAEQAINDTIGEVAEGKTVVDMINAAKAAATTKVVEGTDGGNNLEVVSATSEDDGSVTYTINLTDVASATALTNEVSRATEAEAALQSQIGSGFSISSTVEQAIDGVKGRLDVIEGEGDGSIKKAVADEKTRAEKAESDLSDRVANLEDNTITGSTNVVASTDESGNTTISLQWGTF